MRAALEAAVGGMQALQGSLTREVEAREAFAVASAWCGEPEVRRQAKARKAAARRGLFGCIESLKAVLDAASAAMLRPDGLAFLSPAPAPPA